MYLERQSSAGSEGATLTKASAHPSENRSESPEECADLRRWFPAPMIVSWIDQEKESLGRIDPQVRALFEHDPERRLQPMLSLLVFAYAGQMFDSDEIAGACRSDATFQQLCHGQPPFTYELQGFRHKHRALIEWLLTRVLVRAIKTKFDLDASLITAELEKDLKERASQRLDIARHLDTGNSYH